MKHKEIEQMKVKLSEILKEDDAGTRLRDLQPLAKQVGASTTRMVRYVDEPQASNKITETEIVHNIQEALRTETMIDMCKNSARNLWVALIATAIALLATLAAWASVLYK